MHLLFHRHDGSSNRRMLFIVGMNRAHAYESIYAYT